MYIKKVKNILHVHYYPIRDQISAVVKTLFHSTWRYHHNTCTQEFYYECDWNGARIIVHVLIIMMDQFNHPPFSTLPTMFGHLEGVGSHKNTRYEKVCAH